MAYNTYYPTTYQPLYPQQTIPIYPQQAQPIQQPMPSYQQSQTQSSSITWVQGKSGAKAHPVPPGSNALLMDAEGDRFFIKSVDASGMPMPLREFEYHEIFQTDDEVDIKQSHDEPKMDMSEYAKQKDIDELKQVIREMNEQMKKLNHQKEVRNNGKQSV